MRQLRTSTLILVSLAATALFYGALALALGAHRDWLHSMTGPNATLFAKLGVPLHRAASALALIAGCAFMVYLLYALLARTPLASRRVAPRRATRRQIAREMLLMANAQLAIGVQAAMYTILKELGYTRIYADVGEHGWAYALFSAGVFLVLSDGFSYFSHLAFHRSDLLYSRAHRVHHLSVVTTPWTTNQGSPLELLLPTLFGVLMVTTIPFAMPVLLCVTVAGTLHQMIAHGGIEVFPRGTATHPLGRWIVTPTYHQMHHEMLDANLGLHFTWWDCLMGTRNAGYAARFARVTGDDVPGMPQEDAVPT